LIKNKTNADRIVRIAELAEEHFGTGTIKFVGVKFEVESGTWIAKLKLNEIYNYDSFSESGDSVEKAVKALKNRVKRIVKRYSEI
jgi:hypothetical protein